MPNLHRDSRPLCALTIMVMLLGLLSVGAQQPPPPPQVSLGNSGAFNLSLTVTNKTGQAVAALRKEDIRVLEDGKPQDIVGFAPQTDKPLSIAILLDMSISQEKVIPVAKSVAREFVDSVIHSGRDSVGVVTFTGEAKVEQELTTNQELARQAIDRVKFEQPPGYVTSGMIAGSKGRIIPPVMNPDPSQVVPGSTAIWDTILFTSEKLSLPAPGDTRRVIILLTDGNDTSSKRKVNDAAKAAIKSGVAVYSIGIGDEYYGGTSEDDLRKLAERTGGRAFFPKKVKDLQAVFAEIEQALRSQYVISYSSTGKKTGDKMRKIEIELVNPELRRQGLQLSYQQGYFTR
jgi:Ca-activated chloride channel family protein